MLPSATYCFTSCFYDVYLVACGRYPLSQYTDLPSAQLNIYLLLKLDLKVTYPTFDVHGRLYLVWKILPRQLHLLVVCRKW